MPDKLAKYILTTVAYYDIMDYPMTAFEIWKYLTIIQGEHFNNQTVKYSLADVVNELERDDKLQKFLKEFQGYYFLNGRKDLVALRLKRNKISEIKYKKLLRIVHWLRFVPYIRAIGVAGRLAMKNAEQQSDWDILIIFKKNKIFTGRFFATALVHFLGKRRYGNKICDRVCLNHFLTEWVEVEIKDIFSAHNYAFLVPIFGWDVLQKFQLKNEWIKISKPNFSWKKENLKMVYDNKFTKTIRRSLEYIVSAELVENILKKWQLKKIEQNPSTKKIGSVIIATDEELAFWPNFENQGPKIFENFQVKIAELKKLL